MKVEAEAGSGGSVRMNARLDGAVVVGEMQLRLLSLRRLVGVCLLEDISKLPSQVPDSRECLVAAEARTPSRCRLAIPQSSRVCCMLIQTIARTCADIGDRFTVELTVRCYPQYLMPKREWSRTVHLPLWQ